MEKLISITGNNQLSKGTEFKSTDFPVINDALKEGFTVKSVHFVPETYSGYWTAIVVLELIEGSY